MKKRLYRILLLPGDGIGPEIMAEAVKIIDAVSHAGINIEIDTDLIGGAAIEKYGMPITETTIKKAKRCDAVLLGAVGGRKWDSLSYNLRPEQGLLLLRKSLKLFANLRPVKTLKPLLDISPLKSEIVNGVDFIIVRELTSGIYFGKPRGIKSTPRGEKGYNTEVYYQHEIERIAHIAFQLAQKRRKKVTSVDKANVLESSILWRKVVNEVHKEYPDVELNHLYVDNCAMQIIKDPKQFDIILTNNIFGDILSDESAMLTGSIGMLPSASLGRSVGLYEPVHGSAPDIAGRNIANPCGIILSLALLFRYSLNYPQVAQVIEEAVERVIAANYRTKDIAGKNSRILNTSEIGDCIKEEVAKKLTP